MQKIVGKVAQWTLGTTLLMIPLRALRQSIQDLRAIDTRLTELSRVTDLTRDSFQRAGVEALQMASRWGRAVNDVLQAQVEFGRAGFQNYQQLGELSTILQTAGSITSDLANDMIVAMNAGFSLGGSYENLSDVLNGLNQITNTHAVSMQDMAQATQVFASSAALAGETTQTMGALISTAVSTTARSGGEIGRALNQMAIRIRRIRSETEDGIIDEEAYIYRSSSVNPIAQGCAA